MGSGVVQCRDIRFGRFGERILHQFGGVCDERYELRKLGRHIGVGLEGESLWLMSAVPYPLGGCRVRASEKAPHVACHPMGWCEVIPLISVEQMVSKLHDDISTRPFLSLNGEEAGEEGEIFRYANNGSHAYKKSRNGALAGCKLLGTNSFFDFRIYEHGQLGLLWRGLSQRLSDSGWQSIPLSCRWMAEPIR